MGDIKTHNLDLGTVTKDKVCGFRICTQANSWDSWYGTPASFLQQKQIYSGRASRMCILGRCVRVQRDPTSKEIGLRCKQQGIASDISDDTC